MTPWITEAFPERLAALQRAAHRWEGTPFRAHSASPGPRGGVCCHGLVAAVYREAGFLLCDVPDGATSHARYNATSIMEEWIAGRPEFERLPTSERGDVRPGDLVGFRIFRAIHHLGICTAPGTFHHAIEHLGTTVGLLADPTWGKRLAAIWRPVTP